MFLLIIVYYKYYPILEVASTKDFPTLFPSIKTSPPSFTATINSFNKLTTSFSFGADVVEAILEGKGTLLPLIAAFDEIVFADCPNKPNDKPFRALDPAF